MSNKNGHLIRNLLKVQFVVEGLEELKRPEKNVRTSECFMLRCALAGTVCTAWLRSGRSHSAALRILQRNWIQILAPQPIPKYESGDTSGRVPVSHLPSLKVRC